MLAVYKILVWPLLVAPWAAIPVCGFLAWRGRYIRALLVAIILCIGLWFAHYSLVFYLEGGRIDAGPAFVLHLVLDYAFHAFGICVAVVSLIWLWRILGRNMRSQQ